IAAGAASFFSAPLWGRMADRSSRRVMVYAASLAAVTGMITFSVATLTERSVGLWWFPLAYFLLSIAHAGVRLGRKTHLVDIASADNRASYVAVSNTVIGIMLLLGGALAGAVAGFGSASAIVILAAVSALAAWSAAQLDEAQ
ncbi:MAG: MFS transporter, partial [Woeseia sp.]